ncbi:MAG: hypothetical protein ACYC6C_03930 [Coriobacteriia bacterium]
MADIHRLRNPFEHWFSGLVLELVAFSGFIAVVALVLVLVLVIAKAM